MTLPIRLPLRYTLLSLLLVCAGAGHATPSAARAQTSASPPPYKAIYLEDFEDDRVGTQPDRWQYIEGREFVDLTPKYQRPSEFFEVLEENGNKFVRGTTVDEAHRIIRANGWGFDWNLRTHPRLSWRWRAVNLPENAREDEEHLNDTGAAVYVTFDDKDWLGRPKSIKYTYSSTLPVGTEVSYGPLKVIVVSSAASQGTGKWVSVERNVLEDFKRLFGKDAASRPLAITAWADSDTMHDLAQADFDDFRLLPVR